MDKAKFDSLYYRQRPSKFVPKRKITKILPQQSPPAWLCSLGEPTLTESLKWELHMPDCLVAHVAGHKLTAQEFSVSSEVDLLADIFDLVNSKLVPPPKFGIMYPSMVFTFSSLRYQFRNFALAWAQAKSSYAEKWSDPEFMEHVVIPTLATSVEGIKSSVLAARQLALATNHAPIFLKRQYFSAPVYPLWPDNPSLISSLKQFFLAKTQYRGTSSYHRARATRPRGQRGYPRGRRSFLRGRGTYRYHRSRGWRRGSVNMLPVSTSAAQEQRK